jgi:translation initiation factor 2 alpha subunit (eIF-2alpha)
MKIRSAILSVTMLFALGTFEATQAQTTTTDQGIDSVEVIKVNATVQKVDLKKRKVTLLMDNGKRKTFKVDKSVQNLDQVKVGDQLKIAYTEEILIMVGKSNETPGAVAGQGVAVAPKGAKPGMVMVDTVGLSAKILAVNAPKHRVTLEEPNGKKKTIKVSKKFQNLDQLQPGQTVDVVITESVVVEIVN